MQDLHPDPYVRVTLTTPPNPYMLLEKFQAIAVDHPPKVEALIALYQATLGIRPFEEAFQLAESVYHEPSNIDLHFLFLLGYLRAALFQQPNWPLINLLTERAYSLETVRTPAELRAWLAYIDSIRAFQAGDVHSGEGLATKSLKLISPQSPHYDALVLHRAFHCCNQGRGKEAEAILEQVRSETISIYEERLQLFRFFDAAMRGAVEHAKSLMPGLIDRESVLVAWPTELRLACSLLTLYDSARGAKTPLSEDALVDREADWFVSTDALLAHDPVAALDFARAYTKSQSGRRTVLGFDEYTLIRAELANGNNGAAKQLLERRFTQGAVNYIDDFFLGRIELFHGKRERAASHFAKVVQEIQTFDAGGRLDLELRLALELSISEFFELTQQSAKAPPERILAIDEAKALDPSLIYRSSQMIEIAELIQRFAAADLPVLITGETGTGKELVAESIHAASARAAEPFIAINCAAIPEALIESELFGHQKGAFTGASHRYRGLFLEAEAGTLFLDEIGEISPRLQVALLRVLETGEVRPVGSAQKSRVKCRVITATNSDIRTRANEGTFRRDLLYRLERLNIDLPPLRERPEDIPLLAEHFLSLGREAGQKVTLAPMLCRSLLQHSWPGNVRELRNAMEKLRILNSDKLEYSLADFREVVPTITSITSPGISELPEQPASTGRKPLLGGDEIGRFLRSQPTRLRRLDHLREIFRTHRRLQLGEIAEILGVSRVTASKYLKELLAEGAIERVCPSGSTRSNYYRFRE